CRPAQGQRLKHEGTSRMPAKTQANHIAHAIPTPLRTAKNPECPGTSPPRADLIFPVHIERIRRIGCARIEPAK
ncbi:hypothetical protein, partial [Paraburkholderia hospita]|uniref:hypothetical protein n=1 Tax=Paraburkholderia hospita TaxID=169430 RepID=UPI001A984100